MLHLPPGELLNTLSWHLSDLAGNACVNTNAPDDEELAVSFGIQNGAAAAKVMTMDYISAGKERTANTEL